MIIPVWVEELRGVEIKHRRRVWKPFMEKYNIQKIAEIGVFEGFNFNLMIEHNPEVAVGVDMWIDDGIIARNDCGYPQERLNGMYNSVMESVKDKPFAKIMRMYTVDAAKFFPDEYFDLIYIDADHTYEGCKADMEAWWPKLKKGGFFTGDDYSRYRAKHTGVVFGVIEAVDEFAKNNGVAVHELSQHGWAIEK
jgi:hypothetical protein